MSKDPYGINEIIKKAQREASIPMECTQDENRERKTSFKDRLLGGMVERAQADGETISFEKEEPAPPTPKAKPATVLPSIGTRRVSHGIRHSTGVFSIIHNMQELDEDAFMLFYLEASREYEDRTGAVGWTKHVMKSVLETGGKEETEPIEKADIGLDEDIIMCNV